MNASLLLLAPALFAAAIATAAPQKGLADTALAPASITAMQTGEAALQRRETQVATDSFEAAIAADPRNTRAYVGMARAAEADGLPGKAARFYREALEIDPSDLSVIEAQGNAYLARGAKARAEANLDRLKKLCTNGCPESTRLAAAIARNTALASAETQPKP